MRWHVEAADAKTGRETVLTIEALTEGEAERLARYNGLLVAGVRKAGPPAAPVVGYAGAMADGAKRGERAEPWTRLARRARATGRLGVALGAAGWVAVAGAAGVFAYLALRAGWGDWGAWREWLVPAARQTGVAALVGVAGVTAGSVLRLLAALAGVIGGAGPGVRAGRDAGARIAECGEVAVGAVEGGAGTVAGG